MSWGGTEVAEAAVGVVADVVADVVAGVVAGVVAEPSDVEEQAPAKRAITIIVAGHCMAGTLPVITR